MMIPQFISFIRFSQHKAVMLNVTAVEDILSMFRLIYFISMCGCKTSWGVMNLLKGRLN